MPFRRTSRGRSAFGHQPHVPVIHIGKATGLLQIEPDPNPLQCLFVVEGEGEFVPIDHLHPSVAEGAGREDLHGIGQAMDRLHDRVRFHAGADMFLRQIHHEAADDHAGGLPPVEPFYRAQ